MARLDRATRRGPTGAHGPLRVARSGRAMTVRGHRHGSMFRAAGIRRHPKLIESADCCLFVMARPGRTGVNLMRCRRRLWCAGLSPAVMARLDRATRSGTVPRRVARSSRAMTLKENDFLRHCPKLTTLRSSRAITLKENSFIRHWPKLTPMWGGQDGGQRHARRRDLSGRRPYFNKLRMPVAMAPVAVATGMPISISIWIGLMRACTFAVSSSFRRCPIVPIIGPIRAPVM